MDQLNRRIRSTCRKMNFAMPVQNKDLGTLLGTLLAWPGGGISKEHLRRAKTEARKFWEGLAGTNYQPESRRPWSLLDIRRLYLFLVTFAYPDVRDFGEYSGYWLSSDSKLSKKSQRISELLRRAEDQFFRFGQRRGLIYNDIDMKIIKALEEHGYLADLHQWPVQQFLAMLMSKDCIKSCVPLYCEGRFHYGNSEGWSKILWAEVTTSTLRLYIEGSFDKQEDIARHKECPADWVLRLRSNDDAGKEYAGDYYYLLAEEPTNIATATASFDKFSGKLKLSCTYEEYGSSYSLEVEIHPTILDQSEIQLPFKYNEQTIF